MAKEFVETVKLFLQEDEALVCIIGAIFKPFKIQRGHEARSPFAPYLFNHSWQNSQHHGEDGRKYKGSKGHKTHGWGQATNIHLVCT
jgi:hypothetical protein